MADQETRREEDVVEGESTPQRGRVSIAQTPESGETSTAETTVESTEAETSEAHLKAESLETHAMADIDLENLRHHDEVAQLESVPPLEEADDIPFELQEIREAAGTPKAVAEIREERKLGPFTASMWFLIIAIASFVIALIMLLFR